MTVCVPRNFDGPSSAEHEPIKISLSVTPATPCACAGKEAVNANTQITLSSRPRFKIEFFISLSPFCDKAPWGWNFCITCLVPRSGDVNALGELRSVAVSCETCDKCLGSTRNVESGRRKLLLHARPEQDQRNACNQESDRKGGGN